MQSLFRQNKLFPRTLIFVSRRFAHYRKAVHSYFSSFATLQDPVSQRHKTTRKLVSGFTLLEILLVVAAIAILAGIIILAINPSKQLAETKNAQRRIDVNTILNAVYQYAIDNNGALPTTITTIPTEICKTGNTPLTCTGLVDLSVLTSSERYLITIPYDPTGSTTKSTGYRISKDAYGRITVSAPYAEANATIKVTR